MNGSQQLPEGAAPEQSSSVAKASVRPPLYSTGGWPNVLELIRSLVTRFLIHPESRLLPLPN